MELGNSRRSKAAFCKRCGAFFDAVSQIGEVQTDYPEPGSLSICATCGNLAIFIEGGELREITEEEVSEALKDTRVLHALRAVFHLRLERLLKDAKG